MPLRRPRSAALSWTTAGGLRIAEPSDLARSHIVGAHQLDNLHRRRQPINGVLAREDAAMPDAFGIDDDTVPVPQLVDGVADPRPGRELRRRDACRPATSQRREHLGNPTMSRLFRLASYSEAGEHDINVDWHHDGGARTQPPA
jgi:hypothetical protein